MKYRYVYKAHTSLQPVSWTVVSPQAVWRNVTLLIGCIHRPASNCYAFGIWIQEINGTACRGITPLAVQIRVSILTILCSVVARLETDNIQRAVHQPSAWCIPSATCWLLTLIVHSCRSKYLQSKPEYTGWREKRGHPISLQIFWKLHNRIA